MTAAAQRHHVVVLLQNHVLLVVKVQQADGLESVRDAARRPHLAAGDPERVHDGAHRGVVGGSQAHPQREGAGASAVVGVVPAGRDDPARPADLIKVNKEGRPLAGLGTRAGGGVEGCTPPPAEVGVRLQCSSCRPGQSC